MERLDTEISIYPKTKHLGRHLPFTIYHLPLLRSNRLLSRLPLCLAKTTSLKRLNYTQRFFSRTADVQIVNNFVTQNTFRIDYEQPTKCNALIFDQHAIITRYLLR